jgi:hypothetical protein
MTRQQFLHSLLGFGIGAVALTSLAACASDGSPRPGNPDPDAGTGGTGGTGSGGTGSGSNGDQGSGAGSGSGTGEETCDTPHATIGSNHGHVMTISASDLELTAPKTYNIQGSAAHSHSVTLTVASFATIRMHGQVMVTSTNGANHTHSVTVNCA